MSRGEGRSNDVHHRDAGNPPEPAPEAHGRRDCGQRASPLRRSRLLPALGSLCLSALLALACATPGAAPPESTLVIEDVLPDLWRFWDAHRSDARADQVRTFRATVIAAHPGLLGPEVFGGPPADREVEQLLVELPRLEPKLRNLSERMPGEARRVTARFAQRFPEFAWRGPLGFSLSFGGFEAVWRTVRGQKTLVLGLDAIAYYRGPYANVAPLLDHSFARNLLPAWAGKGDPPFWWSIWERGYPLVVARTLNPEASPADLNLPAASDGEAAAALPALARRARAALDSTRDADRHALAGGPNAPAGKAGPLLSLQVAEQVVGGTSLPDAAHLSGPPLRSRIDAALTTLARSRE